MHVIKVHIRSGIFLCLISLADVYGTRCKPRYCVSCDSMNRLHVYLKRCAVLASDALPLQ